MQLALAYPGTTPTYWCDVPDEVIVTALDELHRRAERTGTPTRRAGVRRGRSLR